MAPPLDSNGFGFIAPPDEQQKRLQDALLAKYYPEQRLEEERVPLAEPVKKDGAIPVEDEPAKPESTPPVVPPSTSFNPPRTNVATGPVRTEQGETLPEWDISGGAYYGRRNAATSTTAIPEDATAALQATDENYSHPSYGLPGAFGGTQKLAPSPAETRDATNQEDWSIVGAAASTAARRFGDIAGNLLDLGSQLADYQTKIVESTGLDWAASMSRAQGKVFENFGNWANSIQEETGYKPQHSIENAWEGIKEGNPLPSLMFAIEQAPSVAVDVAAAVATFPAYLASMVQDFATDRAVNDGRDPNSLSLEDYAWAVPTALLSSVVDRYLGSGKTVGQLNKWVGRVQKEAPGFWNRLAVGAGEGAVTEAISGGGEEIGTSIHTAKGVQPGQVGLGMLGEGLAGGPVGGVIHAVTGGKPAIEPPAVEEDGVGADVKAAAAATTETPIANAVLGGASAIPEPTPPVGPGFGPAPPLRGPMPGPTPPVLPGSPGMAPPLPGPGGPLPGQAGGFMQEPPVTPGNEPAARAVPLPEETTSQPETLDVAGAAEPGGEQQIVAPPGELEEADLDLGVESGAKVRAAKRKAAAGAAKAIVAKPAYRTNAGAQLLGKAPSKRGQEQVFQAEDRTQLERVFQNASDLARIEMGKAEEQSQQLWKKSSDKQAFNRLARRMEDAAIAFAQARETVARFAEDTTKSPAWRTAQSLLHDKQLAIDLRLLGMLEGNALEEAASSTDVEALRAQLKAMDQAAHGQLQSWKSQYGEELPQLPEQGKPQGTLVRSKAEQRAMEARNELRESQQRNWTGRSTTPSFTAKDLLRDWSGTAGTNPNYGKLLKGIPKKSHEAREAKFWRRREKEEAERLARGEYGTPPLVREGGAREGAIKTEIPFRLVKKPEGMTEGEWIKAKAAQRKAEAAEEKERQKRVTAERLRLQEYATTEAAQEARALVLAKERVEPGMGPVTPPRFKMPGRRKAEEEIELGEGTEAEEYTEEEAAEAGLQRAEAEREREAEGTERELAEAAEAEEAEVEAEEKKPTRAKELTTRQKYRRDMQRLFGRHMAEVSRKLKAGDIDKLRVMAAEIWQTRKTSHPKRGAWVLDPHANEREVSADAPALPPGRWPYTWVTGFVPAIDPSQPGRRRYLPQVARINGKDVEFYMPDHYDPAAFTMGGSGWRYGYDRKMAEGPFGKVKPGFKPFPKNANIFNRDQVDALVEELMAQQVADKLTDLQMIAAILVDHASKKNFRVPSGARGYNKGKRQKFGTVARPGVDTRKPRRVKVGPGGKVTPIDPSTPEDEIPDTTVDEIPEAPPADETIDEEAIKKVVDAAIQDIMDAPEPDEREPLESLIQKLIEKLAKQNADIAIAEAMLPRMDEITETLEIGDDNYMTLDELPDGWPTSSGWFREFSAWLGKDGKIYKYEPGPDPVETHRMAIRARVRNNIEMQKDLRDRTEKELKDARESWSEGGGGGKRKPPSRPGPTVPTVDIEPTEPFEPGQRPDTGVPGARVDEHPGAITRVRGEERQSVDLFSSVERESYSKSNVFNEYGLDRNKGTVDPSPEQIETAERIMHRFRKRMSLLLKDGWEASVNAAGFLVMNGTGSGKTLVTAMVAEEIYQQQPGDKKPVAIVHQTGLGGNFFGTNEDIGAFRQLGLDPNNGHYVFISYYDLDKHSKRNKKYAAILFDESHNIKSATKGQWASSADLMDAPFRVFLSATPTDKPMQETYYLAYMNPDETTPITLGEEMTELRKKLGTTGMVDTTEWDDANKKSGGELAVQYVKALDKLVTDSVASNMATSYTLGSRVDGDVTPVSDLDPEIMEWMSRTRDNNARKYMNEYLKVPAMVNSTLDQLERGENFGVINVFNLTNAAPAGKPYTRLIAPVNSLGHSLRSMPAMDYFKKLLEQEAERRGIEVKVGVIKGSMGDKDAKAEAEVFAQTAKDFQNGRLNVLIMADQKGGTGVNLDDYTGNSPKLMQIASTQMAGQSWIQLLGRIDRKSTTTKPFARFFATGTPYDDWYRAKIKDKVGLERTVTGAARAHEETRARAEQGKPDPTRDFTLGNEIERSKNFRRPTFSTPRHETPVDSMLADRLAAGPISATDLITQIAINQTDAPLAALAQAMKDHPYLAGIRVVPMSRADVAAAHGAQGYAEGDFIALDPSSGGWLAITALHEAAHHVVHRAIDNQNQLDRRRLLQIMRHVPLTVMPGVEGIHTNPHEFVAEAFSNPEFQVALEKIRVPATRRNLWQHFTDFVKSLFGARGSTMPAWDAILKLRLTEPDTVTNIGAGDPSAQLATRMLRVTTDSLTKARAAYWLSDRAENLFPKLLRSMTFHQIVKTFGRDSMDRRNGEEVNHLQRIYDLMRDRFARVQKERVAFDRDFMTPLQDYARDRKEQRDKITVTMAPGEEPVRITKMQYLSEVFNISGYGKFHLGKDASDKANAVLGDPTSKDFKRTRSNEFWDLHKPQFDRLLGARGKELYNRFADRFAEEIDLVDVMRAQQFLDITQPLANGQSWMDIAPSAVRAAVKKLGELTDEDLKEKNISRPALGELHAMLEPGRVPGAYFPLTRHGDYVVTVKERLEYTTDEQRDELIRQYIGSTDIKIASEVEYKSVNRFESQAEARAFIAKMRTKFSGNAISEVMLSSSTEFRDDMKFGTNLVTAFNNRIDAQDLTASQKAAQKNMFLQSMIDLMPESRYADTFRPRKGILGAATDPIRSFAGYGSNLAHYKAAAIYASQQRKAMQDFRGFIYYIERTKAPELLKEELRGADPGKQARKLRAILNELADKEASATTAYTDTKWLHNLNNLGFAYYLVGASYNIINATQPALISMPYLSGRFGMVKTLNAMQKAYRLVGPAAMHKMIGTAGTMTQLRGIFTGEDFDKDNYAILKEITKNLSPQHRALLEKLAERNQIEATIAMDMAQAAERSHVNPVTGEARRQGPLSYLAEWMRTAPHIVEVLNRSVTAVAAYDLEFARLKAKGLSDAEATTKATEYASDAIDETQFNYQNWNKPTYMQKPMMRAILMFKQHPQHIYAFMIGRAIKSSRALTKRVKGQKLTEEEALEAKEATRQLGYFVGMHMLAAGAIGGTPEPIKWMIGALMAVLGDDDEPFDFELWVQQGMNEWAGQTWGDILSRGLLSATGADPTSRIGINNLVMFDAPDMAGSDVFMADVARLVGGPLASLGQRFTIDAWLAFQEGDYYKFARQITPKALRDPIHAIQIYRDNGFRTSTGKIISDSSQLTPYNYFLTSMGFTPTSTSEMYLSRTVDYHLQTMEKKKSALMRKAYDAISDRSARDSVNTQIRRWNADNPYFRITVGQLRRSFASRRRGQDQTIAGVTASKGTRGWVDERNSFRGLPQPTIPVP